MKDLEISATICKIKVSLVYAVSIYMDSIV